MREIREPFKVRLVRSEKEREAALIFIADRYFQRYRAAPLPPPQILFAAYRSSMIVGTISLDFDRPGHPLPLERFYVFERCITPWPFHRGKIAQYGNWTAIDKDVAGILAFAATSYACGRRKEYGLCEVVGPVAARLRKLDVELEHISDARLLMDRVPEDVRPHYQNPQPPQIYMMRLEQVYRALREKTIPLFEQGEIIFDPSIVFKS